ncbi:MAG: hypothetical protein OXQ31_14495 [Spirochaetaceae bacterium]|nr:hypothetical protein [Spirochaetaceae bacterium]
MNKLVSLVVSLGVLIAASGGAQTISNSCISFHHLPPGEGYLAEEVFSTAGPVFAGTSISLAEVGPTVNPLIIERSDVYGRALSLDGYRIVVKFPRTILRLEIRGSSGHSVTIMVNGEERSAARFDEMPPFAGTFMALQGGDRLAFQPDNETGVAYLEIAGVELRIGEVCVARMITDRR